MIFDCFLFFDEIELLDLRLNELDPVVDRFVLVEIGAYVQQPIQAATFRGHKQKCARFLDKIEHVTHQVRD